MSSKSEIQIKIFRQSSRYLILTVRALLTFQEVQFHRTAVRDSLFVKQTWLAKLIGCESLIVLQMDKW